ncbi:MAG: DUF983 domain-containing protein [Pseudomonadota bacterium]
MAPVASYPPVSPIVAGLRCRCPRCGEGRLFKGYLTLVDECEHCGLHLADSDSGDGPAVFLIFIVGFLAVGLAIWVEVTWEPAVWVHALVSGGFVIGLSLLLLRPAKAYVMALQYRHRRDEFEG